MTDTERKALALSIEVREDARMRLCPDPTLLFGNWEALCRAIERHEAFRQEVSGVADSAFALFQSFGEGHRFQAEALLDFIIAKPDPLVEALRETYNDDSSKGDADAFRAAIEKRGGKIVWGEG